MLLEFGKSLCDVMKEGVFRKKQKGRWWNEFRDVETVDSLANGE
jgi:hypothetical protein